MSKRAEIVATLLGVMKTEDRPYFHIEWIMDKVFKLTPEEKSENERYWARDGSLGASAPETEGGSGDDFGGGSGDDFGAGSGDDFGGSTGDDFGSGSTGGIGGATGDDIGGATGDDTGGDFEF